MDRAQYSTLLGALQDMPDPRQACWQRDAGALLWALIGGAGVSGQRTVHAWPTGGWTNY